MAGNNTSQIKEIKRLASEMAFQFRALTIDDSTAKKFSEQTQAKIEAEEWLKKFQEDELDKLNQVFE